MNKKEKKCSYNVEKLKAFMEFSVKVKIAQDEKNKNKKK